MGPVSSTFRNLQVRKNGNVMFQCFYRCTHTYKYFVVFSLFRTVPGVCTPVKKLLTSHFSFSLLTSYEMYCSQDPYRTTEFSNLDMDGQTLCTFKAALGFYLPRSEKLEKHVADSDLPVLLDTCIVPLRI